MTISDALSTVRARILAAAEVAARDPTTVKLVAVSKTQPPEAIRAAYGCGQRAFGESYAQELAEKAVALADLPDLEWHFIGHLQSNKAKWVARTAHLVHSVDSAELAAELGKRADAAGRSPLRVLVEVKLSGEATKHGVSPSVLADLLDAIERDARLQLRGLMTMPPPADPAVARRVFDDLVRLRAPHGGVARLPELSMGMSADLEIAIACGATIVRVGSAIFGDR